MRCSRCEYDNLAGAKFCGGCGTRLEVALHRLPRRQPRRSSILPRSAGRRCALLRRHRPCTDAYTPWHLAARILTSRAALEGEHKQITVLFADLKTPWNSSAAGTPEQARRLLDPVLEHMMEAVHRYEGTVSQVTGRWDHGPFGAPRPRGLTRSGPLRGAPHAGIGELPRRDDAPRRGVCLQIRIGLNSGDVVVRSIGSDLRMDYSAVGQTTHLAARMEQMATPEQSFSQPAPCGYPKGSSRSSRWGGSP